MSQTLKFPYVRSPRARDIELHKQARLQKAKENKLQNVLPCSNYNYVSIDKTGHFANTIE